MPNCPNSYASLHARRPCMQQAGGIGVYITCLVASYDTHKGKRWLNSNPPNHRGKRFPHRGKSLQYSRIFIPFSVSLWNGIVVSVSHLKPRSMVWFQEQGQCFFIGLSWSIPTIVFNSFFSFSSFCLLVGIVGLGSSD